MTCKSILYSGVVALIGAAILSSPAVAEDSARVLAGYEKTGESVNCLYLRRVSGADPLDDYAIIFEVGGKTYLNELNARCIGLGREKRFSYRTSVSQICKGEIISVIDRNGFSSGACGLGEFQELTEIVEQEETASL